jgi:NDP-sugar pyrophosphorylase family protein
MTRHALVLTAGLGTRLRPLTDVRAKPAIPVAGEPMVRRIIAWLVSHGVDDLVLNLHHLPDTLTAIVGDGTDLGARVRYSWEQPRLLGSAGGPRLAQPIVGADRFLIVNGDTLTDVDVARLAEAHATSGALATLALVPNREFTRYGGVHLDSDLRVVGFTPRGPGAEGSYHFIGVQMVEASAFDAVTRGEVAHSIGGVYDALIASHPGRVRGWVSDAAFWDVGTIADYVRTSEGFAAKTLHARPDGPHRPRIDASARVTRSILWDDVVVHAAAVLDECIVTDGVAVPPGAEYRRAVLIKGDGEKPLVAQLATTN